MIDGDKSLEIITKDNRKFIFADIKNRDEFVSMLKTYANNIEK